MDKYFIFIVIAGTILSLVSYYSPALLPPTMATALFALMLSVITVLIHRQSMKMEVKIRHSESLHNFIDEWAQDMQKYYSNNVEPLRYNISASWWNRDWEEPNKFSGQPLYKDLISVHLKYLKTQLKRICPESMGNLDSFWLNYNSAIDSLDTKCKMFYYGFWNVIDADMERTLGHKLELSFNFDGTDTISSGFIGLIYSNNVSRKAGNIPTGDVSLTIIKASANFSGTPTEFYQVMAYKNDGSGSTVIANVSNEAIANTIATRFKDLYSFLNSTDNHDMLKLNKEILEERVKVFGNKNRLVRMLKAINEYPIFQGDCDFIEV